MPNYAQIADYIANNVATPLGNVAVSEGFSGETSVETRKKTVEFLQHAQVLANNMYVLNEALQQLQHGVSQYQAVPDLLDEATQTKVASNRENTGTVWKRAISDEDMTTVQTGNRGIFPDKRWIIGATVSDGKITQSHVATAGDPEGHLEPGDLTDKYTILYPLPAQWKSIYDGARNSIGDLTAALQTSVSSMPTIEKVQSGAKHGDMQYPNSIFSNLNGTFQESDFDTDSNFSKLKTNGRTDYQNSLLAGKEETKTSGKPTTETDTNTSPSASPTVITTGGGGSAGGYSRTQPIQPASQRSKRGGNLRYKLNEVSSDDIYNQLKEKYGTVPEQAGITVPSGTGSKLANNPTLTPYTSGQLNTPQNKNTNSSYEYTTPKYTPIAPTKYDFSTPSPRTSSDLGTTTSSYTPASYTPTSFTPIGSTTTGSTPSTYLTPASNRTPGATIPSSQFNSMMDRLNNPIVTRGANGAAGMAGMAGRNGSSGGTLSPGGSSPMRENASTFRTGESAAGSQRGTVSGGNTNNAGAPMGRGGMGMMPMMPMSGAGSQNGGKGNKDSKKAQIKNQDGDLYGNDIQSVAPVISAGNKPAGMPQPTKNNNEGDR